MRLIPTLLALYLAMSFVSAVEITFDATSSVYAFDSWSLYAYVTNESVNVSYPDCTFDIKKNGDTVDFGDMTIYEQYAYLSTSFGDSGTHSATIYCEGGSEQMDLSVLANAHLDVDTSPVSSIGDTIFINADYQDKDNFPIETATCTARIYADDSFLTSFGLYYDYGSEAYKGDITISDSGDHRVTVSCSATNYVDVSSSDTFSITSIPVTMNPYSTAVSGYYGDQKTTTISVSPYDTTCVTTYGTITKSYSTQYSLSVTLDFVGSKDVTVTCSAPQYSSTSRTIRFTAQNIPTSLDLGFYPDQPYSFQLFSVVPGYYDNYGRQISGASCSSSFDNQSKSASSFQGMVFRAPAGPASETMTATCSKSGYENAAASVSFNVKPINLYGRLAYSENVKEEEDFAIGVSLEPGVDGECDFNGELTSGGVNMKGMKDTILIKASGEFEFQINESGTLDFTVTCESLGYTDFKESGSLKVTILSQGEEIGASIILTILTIILTVAFIAIRKYL